MTAGGLAVVGEIAGKTLADSISEYHTRGYPIFPVGWDKEPKCNTWKRHFKPWEFKGAAGIAIRSGVEIPNHGYLVCIDFDNDSEKLFHEYSEHLQERGIDPNTLIVRTGGEHHGWHLYYLLDKEPPKKCNRTFNAADIEYRGTGCYTVIPPTGEGKIPRGVKIRRPYEVIYPTAAAFDLAHCKRIELEDWLALSEYGNNPESNNPECDFQVVTGDPADAGETHIQVVTNTPEPASSTVLLTPPYKPIPISVPVTVWERLLRDPYQRLYGRPLLLKWNGSQSESFCCVMHKEKHASASLCTGRNGMIVYMDGHQRKPNPKLVYSILDVYLTCRKIPATVEIGEALFRMVQEYDIWTDRARRLDANWKQIRAEIEFFPRDVLKVADAVMSEGILSERIGRDSFIATCRFIGKSCGISHKTVNRAMNVLTALQLIHKGDDKTFKSGYSTPQWEIRADATADDVCQLYGKLKDAGWNGSMSGFTTALELKAFGEVRTDRRRKPDRKTSDNVDR